MTPLKFIFALATFSVTLVGSSGFAEFNIEEGTNFSDGAPIINVINGWTDYGYAMIKLKKEISRDEKQQLEDLLRKYAVSISLDKIGYCSKSKIEDTGKRP